MRDKAAEQLKSLRRARSGRITSAPVANQLNCVVRCDEVHSPRTRASISGRATACALHQLDAEDMEVVARLIEDEREPRRDAT